MPAPLLTKSLLLSGIECPTKLYYSARPKEYANQRAIDPFLKALAEGGYQVGELAKQYFPKGQEIKSSTDEEEAAKTRRLLEQDQVTLFEAAILYKNLFVRIDILIKDGDHFELIEVKAKSYDPDKKPIIGKRGGIESKWKPKIIDVAYQTHVLQMAYPQSKINSYLMLVDKRVVAATSGINQKFKIDQNNDNRKKIKVSTTLSTEDLNPRLLTQVAVDDEIKYIFEQEKFPRGNFISEIEYLSEEYANGRKIQPQLCGKCKKCEFKCTDKENIDGLKSGFKECWKEVLGWNDSDFQQSNVLDIWNCDRKKLDAWIRDGIVKISDVKEDNISPIADQKSGLSNSQRQWMQIKKAQKNETTSYLDEGLQNEMSRWIFPLHFIDFETASTALPFLKGRHPYEQIAFQFSHHTIDANGAVTHAGQYLNTNPGEFPNYDFVRQLKNNLARDDGTIFRYGTHENTILAEIYSQLQSENNAPEDKDDLRSFIRSITKSSEKCEDEWCGQRCMVNMLDLVKRYYYDPATHGSNSIKNVLPAILNYSTFLKDKYSKPIYGTKDGIQSHNFHDWTWLTFSADGQVINPYTRLPKLFEGIDQEKLELLSNEDTIQHGGAALTAYCRMQFSEMSDYERVELHEALLKYCELDTLGMVMLYEGWKHFDTK